MAMSTTEYRVDVLAVGAHPDDMEIGCGGTLALLARWGHRVAILDLTAGERGTRGTPEERAQEAQKAARILGVDFRDCAGLPDGGLEDTASQREAVIPFIRKYRPRVILTLMSPDRHPDHAMCHHIVRAANYLAGLARVETGQPHYRAPHVYYFHPYVDVSTAAPTFILDVTATFDIKLEALRAYASQFYNPDYPGEETFISTPAFWQGIETRSRYWGGRVGVEHGEPFYALGPMGLAGIPGLG